MFPEAYNYVTFAVTETKSNMLRAAVIDKYAKVLLATETVPTYTENGYIYGVQGLKA